MLNLDEVRKDFAHFLASDPAGRWRMDAAMAYVVEKAYNQGLLDAAAASEEKEQQS